MLTLMLVLTAGVLMIVVIVTVIDRNNIMTLILVIMIQYMIIVSGPPPPLARHGQHPAAPRGAPKIQRSWFISPASRRGQDKHLCFIEVPLILISLPWILIICSTGNQIMVYCGTSAKTKTRSARGIYIYIYTYIYIYMYMYVYIVYVYNMCIYIYTCMFIYVCIYWFVCMCINVHMYVYIYIYIYMKTVVFQRPSSRLPARPDSVYLGLLGCWWEWWSAYINNSTSLL